MEPLKKSYNACLEWEAEADEVIEESTVMFEAMRRFLEEKQEKVDDGTPTE